MRFSPNTLNSVIAVLSVDGVTGITPDRLNAALQALLGESNTSPDLLPGETYLVHDKVNNETLEFDCRNQLEEWLEESANNDFYDYGRVRNFDGYMTVYVTRKQLKVEVEQIMKITFS